MKQDSFDLNRIAKLARLQISEQDKAELTQDFNNILNTVDQLRQVDTKGVEPLHNPLENIQPLRDDIVCEQNQRDLFQTLAPAVEAGLYLVPQVIDDGN